MAIAFINKGLIELRALKTLGWNVKVNDNPLGWFGTGAKYSLAILLRLGHKITLFRGLDRYTFGTTTVTARGIKDMSLVTMTGPDGRTEEMPFTLELGKNWHPWQAYRELHSNTLDEKGTIARFAEKVEAYIGRPDETAILVEGAHIEASYDERNTIFLPTEPLMAGTGIEAHEGGGSRLFYRGVRVSELIRPTLYTYNLIGNGITLTEDRTLLSLGDFNLRLGRMIAKSESEMFLRSVLIAPDTSCEHWIDTFWAETPSDAFVKVYTELRRDGEAITLTPFANACFNMLKKSAPLPEPVKMTKIQEKQLARAVAFCRQMDWYEDKYPIVVVPYAKGGMMALAENGKVILTTACFDAGIKTLVAAILEETLHLRFGFKDLTREFQTYLFNQLVGLAEQITGEPL